MAILISNTFTIRSSWCQCETKFCVQKVRIASKFKRFLLVTVYHGTNRHIWDILLKSHSMYSISNVLWRPTVQLLCFSCLCAIIIRHFMTFSSILLPKSIAVRTQINLINGICAILLNFTFRSKRKSIR